MYRTFCTVHSKSSSNFFPILGLPFKFVCFGGWLPPPKGLKMTFGWSVTHRSSRYRGAYEKEASVSIVWPSQTIPYCWPRIDNSQFDEKMKREKKIPHPFLGHLIVAHQGPLKCESRRPKRSQFFGGHSFFSRITQGFIDAKFSGLEKRWIFPLSFWGKRKSKGKKKTCILFHKKLTSLRQKTADMMINSQKTKTFCQLRHWISIAFYQWKTSKVLSIKQRRGPQAVWGRYNLTRYPYNNSDDHPDPWLVYLPTLTIKINYQCRHVGTYTVRPMDP